jgi:outer membrane lipoprotein-sorting protein
MRRILAVCVLSLAAGCGQTPSSPNKSADEAAARARAVEITDRMLKKYRQAHSYADHASYVEQSVLRGEGVEHELPFFQMSLAFQRPNLLRLTFEEAIAGSQGRRGYDIACDGERIRTSSKEIPHQIQQAKAPPTLTPDNFVTDPIVRDALLERELSDVFPQLAMLLNVDERVAVFPRDRHPRLQEDATLRGRRCYRVASSNPEGTRVLWIDQQDYSLVRMELPVTAHRRAIDPDNNYINLRVWIDFENAAFDVTVDKDSFEMRVPDEARRVTRFVPPPLPDDAENGDDEQDEKKSEAREKFKRDLEAATLAESDD